MCDCHARLDEKLKSHNGRLATGFTASDADGPTRATVGLTLLMQVEKINPRGKKPPHVLPTFCPFCGKRVAEKSLSAGKTTAKADKSQ